MGGVYLDWAATAPPDPDILTQADAVALGVYANPSSLHGAGREAGSLLEESRKRLARVLGCQAGEVIFTSGGTEANNMVLFSALGQAKGKKIILSGIEHSSAYQPAEALLRLGYEVKTIRAANNGAVDPAAVEKELDEDTILVALMLVNNETGAIQPVAEVARRMRSFEEKTGKRIHLHTDAVQALGKIPLDLYALAADSASFSAHKIGGPRGIGALYLRKGSAPRFLYCGGGQEGGRRPGTENLPGAFGFALAAERRAANLSQESAAADRLLRVLISELRSLKPGSVIPQGRSGAEGEPFSPYILCAAFPPLPGEVLVRIMAEEGYWISTGSACSSRQRKRERRRGLEQMGVPEATAQAAVRISLGWATGPQELDGFLTALKRRLAGLKGIFP